MTTYNVPNTFIPGTKAKASEINENFSAVMGTIEEVKQGSANLDLSNLTTAGKQAIFDNSSRSKLIGEIITSVIPLNDSGLHLLDGTKLLGGGIYDSFIDYISDLYTTNQELFLTESEWQECVTDYGVCGKFVYDATSNYVRLPKITGFIEGTATLEESGDITEAGLPNIEGQLTSNLVNKAYTASGSITATFSAGGNLSSGSSQGTSTLELDASLSSQIYGGSDTVQPQSVKVLYYIVIATTAKFDLEVDIDNYATDLANKADKDLSNCTKPYITESYINGTSGYIIYSNGLCDQWGSVYVNAEGQQLTYLKPFLNTNYVIVGSGSDKNIICTSCYNKTTSGCQLWTSDDLSFNKGNLEWRAIGYIS